jgi:hypothetical protein
MNIKIDLSGLERLKRNSEAFHGTHHVKLTEMLSPAFMRSHSHFSSVEDMLTQCDVSTGALAAMSDAEKDNFARRGTTFNSWQELINSAAVEYTKKQLFK